MFSIFFFNHSYQLWASQFHLLSFVPAPIDACNAEQICCWCIHVVGLGAMFHHLEHKCCKLWILCHWDGNWFPLSVIFLLTKPPGLLIILQILAMSSSVRLARVCGKSIPWSSTSFIANVWLNPSLRNISSIYLKMVSGRLSVADAHHSIICILLHMLISSTGRPLVLPFITIVIIWMFRNLLSVLVAITPSLQAHKVYASGWSQPQFCYQLCDRGASSSIPSNKGCTSIMLLWIVSILLFWTT